MEENKEQIYRYSYKASTVEEKREAESILREYKKTELTDMEKLRLLQKKVNVFPQILSLSVGVIGLLIFGGGLAAVLETAFFALGIALSAVGAVVAFCAYPLYRYALNKRKSRYGEEIVRLCENLLKQE